MDREREILNYICNERLDLLEVLKETEIKLQETAAALPEGHDLSSVMENYRSVVVSVENMLKKLESLLAIASHD